MLVSIIIPTKDEPAIQELIDEINIKVNQDNEIIVVDMIGEYDIALGPKLIKGGNSNDTLRRKAVTLAFSILARLILWGDIKGSYDRIYGS